MDNYYYFVISANGFIKVGAKTEGINLDLIKWTESEIINQNNQRNLIKVLRSNDKLYFSINSSLINSIDFFAFHGNGIGFYILSSEILFEKLIIKQDFGDDFNADTNPNSYQIEWKGNGTGFL
ncbi:MAG: hypothetical protein R2784_17965 [Saprospiraceae bacterium]